MNKALNNTNLGSQESWHEYWKNYTINIKDLLKTIGYKREIYALFDLLVGDQKGKDFLEFGGGTGRISLHFAQNGANVSILDSSKEALAIQKHFFTHFNVDVDSHYGDVMNYDFKKQFDLIHSEGLLEHFNKEQRKKLIERMDQLTKPGGKILIMIPNLYNLNYLIGKTVFEKTGQWDMGQENLVDINEFKLVLEKLGYIDIRKGGVFLMSSWNWLIPIMGFNFKVKFGFVRMLRRLGIKDFSCNYLYSKFGRQVAIVATKPI